MNTVLKVILTLLLTAVGVLALLWIVVMVSSLFVNTHIEYTKLSRFYRTVLDLATIPGLFFAGVRIKVTGKEFIPKGHKFLFICNHRSKFDPIIAWRVFNHNDLAFISKPENFDEVPFFGKIIRKCLFLPIDRTDPRKAITTIQTAANFIKDDQVAMGVYPEGTRSKTGELLPFHTGVFKIAQKANVPIIVTTMKGSENIAKNFPLHLSPIQFDILGVIPADEIKGVSTSEIGERVRSMMGANLK